MTDKPIELDQHRGMAAQKATGLRRLLAEVVANEEALRATQDTLEAQLIAAPASNWEEAADKVRYLLSVFAATPSGHRVSHLAHRFTRARGRVCWPRELGGHVQRYPASTIAVRVPD